MRIVHHKQLPSLTLADNDLISLVNASHDIICRRCSQSVWSQPVICIQTHLQRGNWGESEWSWGKDCSSCLGFWCWRPHASSSLSLSPDCWGCCSQLQVSATYSPPSRPSATSCRILDMLCPFPVLQKLGVFIKKGYLFVWYLKEV